LSLITVHRALILSFVALAALFCVRLVRHWLATSEGSSLAGAAVAAALVIAGLVYLAKARHLRRK
jgi:ABC-type uncharacterized transport system permease subunit